MPHNLPIIGISTAVQKTDEPEAKRKNEAFYHEAVRKAGGVPRLISDRAPSWEAEVAKINGLVIIGGVDVDPERYGDPKRPETWSDPTQDDYDLSLLDLAQTRGIPVLGICRGHQLIGVHAGMRLFQHLPADYPSENHKAVHPVKIVEGTTLHKLLGVTETTVNSNHHQAVNFEPARNRVGLKVTALSPAGVVEGMEDGDRILSVQWHPERMVGEMNREEMLALFRWLVEKAKME